MVEQYSNFAIISEVLRHSLIAAQDHQHLYAINLLVSLDKIGIYFIDGSRLTKLCIACMEHRFRICQYLRVCNP